VLVVALWASNSSPAEAVLGGIVAAIAATVFVMLDLAGDISRVDWTRRARTPPLAAASDDRVEAFRRRARAAWLTGSTEINDMLVELVDDRLLARHRVDRHADPTAADELLTPTLRRLLAGPRRQVAAVRELREIVTDIEAL
jgi:hypothetical protein